MRVLHDREDQLVENLKNTSPHRKMPFKAIPAGTRKKNVRSLSEFRTLLTLGPLLEGHGGA
ncbi:hypothetical protein SAMN04488109_4062 [Chryseolinea serpens]|uniref:Uncharacterized protein n=1 Tax=Chryseolinea serpens TaxID=947013 RepID=A0A1M5TG94_9BACT|nr:hypothetical protein SAMN04488109_4062 [Chryseolinea serpens]